MIDETRTNTNVPVVSVVIPTYNQADYLREAIDSVLQQSFNDYEIIIVNNFSTDHTQDIVESFNDPRITFVNLKNNGIIAASRNKGIELSKGKYVAFLDSDEYWYPGKLKICMDAFQLDYDVVCHAELWIKNKKPYKIRDNKILIRLRRIENC